MQKIINNSDNLANKELNVTNKVRAIILNNLEITIVDYANILMLPGGKVDDNEEEKEALKRELKEELGLDINNNELIPFIEYNNYLYNYPTREGKNINKLVTTKYYIVETNNKIDLSKRNLTENEKNQKFKVFNLSILNINELINDYNSNNPRWVYFKKEIMDIMYELNGFLKEETIDNRTKIKIKKRSDSI
jgi:8-oxo-dGTP pyrophosphatase MutT (NUDIX family)